MTPTLILGLDGATFSVLDPLVAAGHMPFLKKLLAEGARANLKSTVHPLTPPAWTTLITGRSPGEHGVYDFVRHEVHDDGFFLSLNNFQSIRCETLWSLVSRAGGSVLSLNYPLAAPPPEVSGVIVPGLLSWRHLRRNVYPPEIYTELAGIPGFKVQDLSWELENEKKALQSLPDDELESWVEFHIRREKQWLNLTEHCLSRDRYDLAAVVFDGVDKLQHGCWRVLDARYRGRFDSPFEERLEKLCLEYFQLVDQCIERIVTLAGPEARLFIVSDHGFGPSERIFRVNKWLEEHNYLRWRASATETAGPQTSANLFTALDWDQTTAYVPSPASNGIYIRRQTIAGGPGVADEQYEAFRSQLIAQLQAIPDPLGDGPLLRAVLTREDAYPGEHSAAAPDITVVLQDYGFVSILDSTPSVAVRPAVIGTHYPEGILISVGPGIRRGVVLPEQSILDLAPTLVYSLGEEVPADFSGQVIEELFEPSYLHKNPIRIGSNSQPLYVEGDKMETYNEAENELLVSRLRALGYVE